MRHRFSAIAAALTAVVFSLWNPLDSAFAADAIPTLSLTAEDGYPGAEIALQICLSDNPGLTAFAAVLTLPDGVTPVTDEAGTPQFTTTDALNAEYFSCRCNPETAQISIVCAADAAGAANDLLGTLPVQISSDVAPNQSLTVGLSIARIADAAGEFEAGCIAENALHIGVLRGDTDLNGKVNSLDAMLALQSYVATDLTMMETPLTETQYAAADVDGNDKVDLWDARAILDYAVMSQSLLEPTWDDVIVKR